MKLFAIFICSLIFSIVTAAPVDLAVNEYELTKHEITLDSDQFDQYRKLAESVGLEYGKEYGYQEYADIQHRNNIGSAGNYDFLLLSTGGDEWDYEASLRFNTAAIGWRMTYYSNHDLTIIEQIRRDEDRIYSYVRLLKLAAGRVPDLHRQ